MDEYRDMGGGYMGFSPLIADPLLDPLFMDRVHILKNDYPNIIPHMFTNLIGLPKYSDDEVRLMIEVFDHIDVSIGGLNPTDYKEMFRVNQFDNVKASLERLASLNSGAVCKLQLHIRTDDVDKIYTDPTLKQIIDLGYSCEDITDTYSNWGGNITQDDLPGNAKFVVQSAGDMRAPCFLTKIYMHIMPNGDVLGCACMDANEETLVTNIEGRSLLNVWRGKEFEALRTSFETGKLLNACKQCNRYTDFNKICSDSKLEGFHPSDNFWKIIG